ncbi:MAG: hypothetical protein GY941_19030 [Planctomycetes bacterium]|nr:hypothetical protein [Planctomycetota bacterium]
MEKVIEKGKIIIDALEIYKNKNREYPKDLESLYPDYLSNEVNLIYEFSYYHVDHFKERPSIKEEIDSWGGYKLVLSNTLKAWRFGPVSNSYFSFVYYPSKLYPERKWEKPVKRVKDWALIIRYRSRGGNPIVGPGV